MIVHNPAARAQFAAEKMGKATLGSGTHLYAGLNCFEPGQEHHAHVHADQDKLYVVLDGTGASGGLVVKGTGAAGSGGTIQHKTGADEPAGATAGVYDPFGYGIFLRSTSNVSLRYMQLNDFDNSAIFGLSVSGFSLRDSVINGVIGTIDNCRQAPYGYDQRVEVLGSKGAIATENMYPNRAVVSTAESVRRDLPLNFFMERYLDSFEREVRDFVNAVVNDTETPVTAADGRVPVVMALAAKKSYLEGRPVKLSEIA